MLQPGNLKLRASMGMLSEFVFKREAQQTPG
jgi:hypothetical protein